MTDETILGRHSVELDIIVRPCRESDLRMLEWGGSYRAHRRVIERAFEGHLRGDNPMLVAEAQGFPVAQLWIDLARREDEGVAILWALRVMPGLRALGIGRVLVRCAERLAREWGFAQTEIGVEHDNVGARRLYEHLGYVEVGEEESSIEREEPGGEIVYDALRYAVMRRDLEPDEAATLDEAAPPI